MSTATDVSWHCLEAKEAARQLVTDPDEGLHEAEARNRQLRVGPNEIPAEEGPGYALLLLGQFKDTMVVVLIVAALIAGLLGEIKDAAMIVVIVLLNAIVGFVQEVRANRTIAALRSMAAPSALVMRDGSFVRIPAGNIVPGDIVSIQAGDIVPADLRLVRAPQLRLDEASLTGESHSVDKETGPLATADLALGDRLNMAYKGTMVVNGRGVGMAVATGLRTELGKLAGLLKGRGRAPTPLQKRLAKFGQHLALIAAAICIIIFLAGYLRGEDALTVFLTAASVAVASMPEALPAVVTVLLALGARKMARHNALVRRLPAVETLGSVTYICSDKTGTLTENRMHVTEVWVGGKVVPPRAEEAAPLMRAIALCNDASGPTDGDPTESALWTAADNAGFNRQDLEREHPRLAEFSFDSVRKRMSTIHGADGGYVLMAKGAPESLLPLTENDAANEQALAAAQQMAARGLRVLAVAERRMPQLPGEVGEAEKGLTILGLVGLIDPPRPEAKPAVEMCRHAGIVPVMITGDHPETARAIASDLGILDEEGRVLTGRELSEIDDEAFKSIVGSVRVYARVDPEQKIRIIEALQDNQQFVAMTGDGVNDAPALSQADIGVAMGQIGTEVAREASSLVLLDDNFASIVYAVREGRRIFDNIRKFVRYTMSSNLGEVLCVFMAPLIGLPIPLLPVQILWINLVTDGLPGLALAAEPREPDLMDRPPRPPRQSLFAEGMLKNILISGVYLGGASLAIQAWAIDVGSENWQTMVFATLTFLQLAHALAIRSERRSLFSMKTFGNPFLLLSLAGTFLLQLATFYVPVLNPVFHTTPLTAQELGICVLVSLSVIPVVEAEKWWTRRRLARLT